jgi:hypothetical protein
MAETEIEGLKAEIVRLKAEIEALKDRYRENSRFTSNRFMEIIHDLLRASACFERGRFITNVMRARITEARERALQEVG